VFHFSSNIFDHGGTRIRGGGTYENEAVPDEGIPFPSALENRVVECEAKQQRRDSLEFETFGSIIWISHKVNRFICGTNGRRWDKD